MIINCNESTNLRIIVSRFEVVQPCFNVKVVASVTERIRTPMCLGLVISLPSASSTTWLPHASLYFYFTIKY